MFKLLRVLAKSQSVKLTYQQYRTATRTFLSQAYYCNEAWDHRLRNPIIERVNLDELYQNLDQRFNKSRHISAIDVDIFANAVRDEEYIDELLDLIHKLRLSAETGNTLNSTSHAVIRQLAVHGKTNELLEVLDDRLNYGIFVDNFTANLLMDIYYKNKDFTSGARVASQLMLQEDFTHPLSTGLSLLHCYNYLLKPIGWPEPPVVEEPEEEIKIRVKYLRNPYYDDHFDIKEPHKLVGKTMWMITKDLHDTLDKSLHLVGLALHGKNERAKLLLSDLINKKQKIFKDALNLLPEDNELRKEAVQLDAESGNIQDLLINKVKQAERLCGEKDVAEQCKMYLKWDEERKEALDRQQERLSVANRITNIEELQKNLKDRETRLWFFENEENIELGIEAKRVYYPKKWFGNKKKPRKVDEGYIPPEVQTKRNA